MGRLSGSPASLDQYIANQFVNHQVSFYHADNIEQVFAHCENNRLLTRRELININPTGKTSFYSDDMDTDLGFDDRIFGNPHDFGKTFVRSSSNCVPNVYGPILFEFEPNTYSIMRDIIITKMSIGTLKRKWRENQVLTEEAVDLILQGNAMTGDSIQWDWQWCELSCEKQAIPLTYLKSIIVEPITVEGWTLEYLVSSIIRKHKLNVELSERPYRQDKPLPLKIIQGLSDFCQSLPADITEADWAQRLPPFPESLGNLTDAQKTRFPLWCRYFYFGSLKFMRDRVAAMKSNPGR